jgi:hypothetical protein
MKRLCRGGGLAFVVLVCGGGLGQPAQASPASEALVHVLQEADAAGALAPLLEQRTWEWREGEHWVQITTEGRYTRRGLQFHATWRNAGPLLGHKLINETTRLYRFDAAGRLKTLRVDGRVLGSKIVVRVGAKGKRVLLQRAFDGRGERVLLNEHRGDLIPSDVALFLLAPLRRFWPEEQVAYAEVDWLTDPPRAFRANLAESRREEGSIFVRVLGRVAVVRDDRLVEVRMNGGSRRLTHVGS